jgi:hypothetical protein
VIFTDPSLGGEKEFIASENYSETLLQNGFFARPRRLNIMLVVVQCSEMGYLPVLPSIQHAPQVHLLMYIG